MRVERSEEGYTRECSRASSLGSYRYRLYSSSRVRIGLVYCCFGRQAAAVRLLAKYRWYSLYRYIQVSVPTRADESWSPTPRTPCKEIGWKLEGRLHPGVTGGEVWIHSPKRNNKRMRTENPVSDILEPGTRDSSTRQLVTAHRRTGAANYNTDQGRQTTLMRASL